MILIALGGNIDSHAGPPARTLSAALALLERSAVHIEKVSAYYVTPAWPDPNEPPYVNAVAHVATTLTPTALLALLHATETTFGRVRSTRNARRTLDLDLLDYNGVRNRDAPQLPHPRLAERAFVLVPLADVASDWVHPESGKTVQTLLAALPPAEIAAVRPISSG